MTKATRFGAAASSVARVVKVRMAIDANRTVSVNEPVFDCDLFMRSSEDFAVMLLHFELAHKEMLDALPCEAQLGRITGWDRRLSAKQFSATQDYYAEFRLYYRLMNAWAVTGQSVSSRGRAHDGRRCSNCRLAVLRTGLKQKGQQRTSYRCVERKAQL